MGQKIIFETTITQLSEHDSIDIRPNTALFVFINNGGSSLYINNLRLKRGERFGVDATPIVAMAILKGMKVENDTNFDVRFVNDYASDRDAHLIETTFKLITE